MAIRVLGVLTILLAATAFGCRGTGPGPAPGGGNPDKGKVLFQQKSCGTCHTLASVPGASGTIGPDLDGIASRAATREPGKTAEQYIDESIREPAAFVVPGYPAPSQGGMLLPVPVTDDERRDLVAFLMTQK